MKIFARTKLYALTYIFDYEDGNYPYRTDPQICHGENEILYTVMICINEFIVDNNISVPLGNHKKQIYQKLKAAWEKRDLYGIVNHWNEMGTCMTIHYDLVKVSEPTLNELPRFPNLKVSKIK